VNELVSRHKQTSTALIVQRKCTLSEQLSPYRVISDSIDQLLHHYVKQNQQIHGREQLIRNLFQQSSNEKNNQAHLDKFLSIESNSYEC